MKEMKKWLALLAITALMLSLGGCGGSSNSSGGGSGSSNDGGGIEALNNNTFESPLGSSVSGTAVDESGVAHTVTLNNFSVSFSDVATSVASARTAGTTTGTVTVKYGVKIDSGNIENPSFTESVKLTEEASNVWSFPLSDSLTITLNLSSETAGTVTLSGAFLSISDGKKYTLTEPLIIGVEKKSSGGDNEDDNGNNDDPGTGGGGTTVDVSNAVTIILNSDGTATSAGASVPSYDWTWHADITEDHWAGSNTDYNEKYSPAEYYTGTVPSGNLYIAHDIVYLPDTLKSSFTGTAKNDNETVYTCNYMDSVIAGSITATKKKYSDVTTMTNCIFAALDKNPASDSSAAKMLHSASDAYNNPVLHIKGAGTYILQGTWNGQIWFEGEDEDSDKVQVILNGVTVTCGVGPAIIFTDFYECDTAQSGNYDVSSYMANAGVKVYLSDGTTNTFTGANLPRILKIQPKYDNDDTTPTTTIDGSDVDQQKKRYKWDGAFHSRVSMAINGGNYDGTKSSGTGILKVVSTTCEGLNSEMHLVIDGGAISVTAPDDAINVNEDNISVFRMNAGTLSVTSTTNGDGIDSNGWIGLEGGSGTIKSQAGGAEKDLDAVLGIYDNTSGAFTYSSVDNEKGGGNVSRTDGGQFGGDNGGGQQGDNTTPPDLPNANGNGGPAMHR